MKLGVFTMWTSQAKVDAPIAPVAAERPATLAPIPASPVSPAPTSAKKKPRARRTKRALDARV